MLFAGRAPWNRLATRRAAGELLDRAGVTSPVAVEVRSSPAPVRVDLSGLTREQVDALAEGGLG